MIYRIRKILEKAAGKEVGQVFISERPEFGNYSTNAAFLLSKELKKSPLEVAKEFAAKIEQEERGKRKEERIFSKVEAAPPGFVNFWLSKTALIKELVGVLKFKKLINSSTHKLKTNVEFISANPTGPLTMANGRGGFWGDVIANVLESVGHKVTREYYINDAGNQIKILGESILVALGKIPAKEEHYRGDYVKESAKKLKSQIAKRKSQNVEDIGRLAATELLKQIKKSVKTAGIKFDVWFSEYKKLRKGGLIKKVLAILEKNNLVSEHDGAKWLKLSAGGGKFARPDSANESGLGLKSSEIADEKDRVLVKSDGEPTYFLSDIAYHYDKFINRKFDKVIDIWGADHHGYVARLKSGVKAIRVDPERLRIIITQLVRLIKKGEEVKMSKRKGEFVTLDELLKEVGKDAARFFFLMQSPDTHMDFDLELAKERSMKNPVYYAQYAFVRCLSILRKPKAPCLPAGRKSQKPKAKNLKILNSDSELNLMKELVKLPYMIQQTAEDYQVNRLTRYVGEIARAFHNFYEKERVIGAEKDVMEARLALVSATRIILGKLLDLLGIDKLKKM